MPQSVTRRRRKPPVKTPSGPIQHVVIIFKENHTFDNYFGRFPGVEGDASLPDALNPPPSDPLHTHEAWLKRATGAVKEQYGGSTLPAYWAYAQQYTLCDHFFTDVAGPSTPNHLMLITADSPIINNPHHQDPKNMQPPYALPSLPILLEKAGYSWGNYGGYVFNYITDLRGKASNYPSQQFAAAASVANCWEEKFEAFPRRSVT